MLLVSNIQIISMEITKEIILKIRK